MKAVIDPQGAELQSLRLRQYDIEYMWQADKNYWGKHAPVLFPIVGSLKNDTYFYKQHAYGLPRHGFARERMFMAEQQSDTSVVCTLEQDETSLRVYPFPFRLQVIYTLQEASLHCTYRVENTGSETLWFSIGGHPAFRVPLTPGSAYSDWYLQFNVPEVLQRYLLANGLITENTITVDAPEGKLQLHPSLFYQDALVFKHLKSTRVTLRHATHQHGLHVDFEGFPYLGIWAAKDAPFVCIEPWCGHADTTEHNQQLTEKPGIERLEPGKDWSSTWKVELF